MRSTESGGLKVCLLETSEQQRTFTAREKCIEDLKLTLLDVMQLE
jgi:hypothetical protein